MSNRLKVPGNATALAFEGVVVASFQGAHSLRGAGAADCQPYADSCTSVLNIAGATWETPGCLQSSDWNSNGMDTIALSPI